MLDVDDQLVAIAPRNKRNHRLEIRILSFRSRMIASVQFNNSSLIQHGFVEKFRLMKKDVGRLSEMVDWSGVTERNQYGCDPIVATCFVQHKLAAPVPWTDIELTYGKHRAHMSEIMWEIVELFTGKYGYALKLCGNFLKRRAEE